MSFSEERRMIEARRDEINGEADKIEELINHLDEQKYESIAHTFQKVSENFSTVFKKLGKWENVKIRLTVFYSTPGKS